LTWGHGLIWAVGPGSSGGRGRGPAVDLVHGVHGGPGPRDISRFNLRRPLRIGRSGTRARDQAAAGASGPSTNDLTARVVCTRGTAAGTPEGGGARRLARRSWPNLSSRARFGARTGSTRRGGRGELTQGLREMARVTAATPR
jgi:hypothetical protein